MKLTKEIQPKCDECIPCKMAGKSINPQLLMSNKLLTIDRKTESKNPFGLHRTKKISTTIWFILTSINSYSKWPVACICAASTRKTTSMLVKRNILLNGIPKTIRTEKGQRSPEKNSKRCVRI